MRIYSHEELKDYSEEELLQTLKKEWGYDLDKPIKLYGRLEKINHFYALTDLRNYETKQELAYPFKDPRHNNVYIGNPRNFNITTIKEGQWFTAEVSLPPKSILAEHENLFELNVIKMDALVKVPDFEEGISFDFSKSTLSISEIESDSYLEKYLYDFHLQKATKEVEESTENLKKEQSNLQQVVEQLEEEEKNSAARLNDVRQEIEHARNTLFEVKSKYNEFIKYQDFYMGQLNEVIKSKVELLKRLDLVDDSDLNKLLFNHEKYDDREGHSFSEDFGSDYSTAVAYIQSYLWENKIVYKRSVLEDFFALVKTHDLIILAGDSGSGKTNLVKSFAKAVGGKSVIVPVKPNWTSAEDLLGYYNPLENKYLSTKFLDALIEAQQNPDIPYFICLDEMNLARVEYYFADFLSLLEERDEQPEIQLFSSSEGEVLASELKNFILLVNETSQKLDNDNFSGFVDIMKDEKFNSKLHELCGFKEGDSLLKYHSYLKKMLNSFINTPSSIKLPKNVRIIGAINVDETTHYLSPKILDRAHIMKFGSPLLADWSEIEEEIQDFDLDISQPINFTVSELGERKPYPEFDSSSELVQKLIYLVRNYLDPLGIEFGLRTIRQALGYYEAYSAFSTDETVVLNNIILHKVLPKLLFDGEKQVDASTQRKDILISLNQYLENNLVSLDNKYDSSLVEVSRVIRDAEANDWTVNYWSR